MAARVATFRVAGMSCTGCAEGLRGLLAEREGVSAVQVDFDTARASLSVDAQFDAAAAQAAARQAGYTLTPVTTA